MKKTFKKMTNRLPMALASPNLIIPLALAMIITIHGVEQAYAAQADTPQKALSAVAPPKVQATVRTVDVAANILVIKTNKNQSTTLMVTPETKITAKDGQPITLGSINKRDEVKVAWSDKGGELVAEEISVILPAQYKKEGQGQGKNKER
jgi:hypothetical protein